MKFNWIVLCFIYAFNVVSSFPCLDQFQVKIPAKLRKIYPTLNKINVKTPEKKHIVETKKLNIIEKITSFNLNKKSENQCLIYYEDWSCGEVEWEFAKDFDTQIYALIHPSEQSSDNTYKSNLKNVMAISSGLVSALYEDVVKLETFLGNLETLFGRIQNINFINFINQDSIIDVLSISFIGLISIGYKKSVNSELNILKSQKRRKQNLSLQEIEDYLKLQRFIKSFALSLLFIFTKNVKSVE